MHKQIKYKKMKKLIYCFIIAITLMCVSCSNDSLDNLSSINGNVLVSNSKFICYKGEKVTRSDNIEDVIIVVHEIPDYEIHSSENEDSNKDEFHTKSIFVKNGTPIFEMYSNVEEREDGWVVRYKCVNGDEDIEFLPRVFTRASWGERTASCLSDAYSGHGWASVWAVIQSGFIPQTAVALAAVCAIKNY